MKRLLTSSFLFLSCCGVSAQGEETVTKARIRFDVANMGSYVGTATLQRQSYYKFTFHLPGKPRLLLVRTCHRTIEVENPANQQTVTYVPVFGIENMEDCMLEVSSINDKGFKSYAAAEFTNGDGGVVDVSCDGQTIKDQVGVSLCDVEHGKEQMLWFRKPAKAKWGDGCPEPWTTDGGYKWHYLSQVGYCGYLFKTSDGQFHRHVVRGWNDVGLDL